MSSWQLTLILFVLWLIYRWFQRRKLPPGPPSVPILGVLPFVSKRGSNLFSDPDMEQKYGSIIKLEFNGKIFIVLNDFKTVKQLFNQDFLSARPSNYFLNNVRGHGQEDTGIIYSSGSYWSAHRRFALKSLRDFGFGKNTLDNVIHDEANELYGDMLKESEANGEVCISTTFNVAIVNVLWQIVASKRFDPDAEETKDYMEKLNRFFRGGNLHIYMFMEFLRPFGPYTKSDYLNFELKDMFRKTIKAHLEDHDPDAPPRDFIDVYLTEMKRGNDPTFDIEQLVVICLDFFQAGAETSSTTLMWAVKYMTMHQDVQEKCQKEIDKVM